MSQPLYFDELTIGARWRSFGRTITQADVVNFACQTGDYDPIHVDHEFARQSVFQGPIAHGLFGMALVAGLGQQSPWACTVTFVGVRDWNFKLPLMVGDTVHVVTELMDKQPRGRRQGLAVWRRQLINQRDEVVQEGIFETLVALAHTGTHNKYRENAVPQAQPAEAAAEEPIVRQFRFRAA